MTSAPAAARSTAARSRTSPSTISRLAAYREAKGNRAREPVEKSSRMRTRTPSKRRRSTKCDPMNPAPPVTKAMVCTRGLYQRARGDLDTSRDLPEHGRRFSGSDHAMTTGRECMSHRALAATAALAVACPAAAGPGRAQTRDDTVIYAVQSDMQNWDPPNSVLRESIILGYNVFDHLAARDLKTGKVGPSLATSWRNLEDSTWEVKL